MKGDKVGNAKQIHFAGVYRRNLLGAVSMRCLTFCKLSADHSRSQSCDPLGQRLGSRALTGSNPFSPLIGQMGTQ